MIVDNIKHDGMAQGNGEFTDHNFVVDPTYYVSREMQRGDIVYFKVPSNVPPIGRETFISRIIALPGEKIEIKKGQVYINGKKLIAFYGKLRWWGMDKEDYNTLRKEDKDYNEICDENCVERYLDYFDSNVKEITLSEHEIFVLGDNSIRSIDSRTFGPLQINLVVGKVLGYQEKGERQILPTFKPAL